MCLYPRLIINRKYTSNKKNGGNIPTCTDERTRYVPVGCGRCIECRKQKAQMWKVRLNEELRENPNAHFVTFTFDETKLAELCAELHTEDADIVSSIAIRRFTERWRKKFKKAPRHFLINELGHTGTERLHFHGLLWYNATNVAELEQKSHSDAINVATLQQIWQYGMIWIGEYVNEKTINYIVKYVTKLDADHKDFIQHIFASKGLGRAYLDRPNALLNAYKGEQTREYYTLPNGMRVNLPIYYRNHIYTEEEREQLWLQKLDAQTRYILGVKHICRTDEQIMTFEEHLKNAQELNIIAGFGEPLEKWDKLTYKVKRDKLRALTHKK